MKKQITDLNLYLQCRNRLHGAYKNQYDLQKSFAELIKFERGIPTLDKKLLKKIFVLLQRKNQPDVKMMF